MNYLHTVYITAPVTQGLLIRMFAAKLKLWSSFLSQTTELAEMHGLDSVIGICFSLNFEPSLKTASMLGKTSGIELASLFEGTGSFS